MKARTANWMLTVMLACLLPSAGVLAQTPKVAISGRYGRMHNLMLGEPIGFEVDLARALAEALGKQLVILDSEDLGKSSLVAVQAGEVEMSLNAVTITEDRKKRVDFTRP